MTKLIIVEGLPGAGKSTTAEMLFDLLKARGIDSQLFLEGNLEHPADYDGVAYFSNEEFTNFMEDHKESNEIINNLKIQHLNGYLLPYKKALKDQKVTFNNAMLTDILKNDIYELPIELHMELIINRWNEFANNSIKQDKVIIFECCFIQNPITVSMIRNNSPKEVTWSYINKLAEIIRKLEPLLLYVVQDSNEESFMKAVRERSKEWVDGFTDYYTNQGYGLYHNLKGIEGVLEILKARSNFEQEVYDSLRINKERINNSTFSLDLLKNQLQVIINKTFKKGDL